MAFRQERIDTEFLIYLTMLHTDLFSRDPARQSSIPALADKLEVLIPLTSYGSVRHLQDMVRFLIYLARNPEEAADFPPELAAAMDSLFSILKQPLPWYISGRSDVVWARLTDTVFAIEQDFPDGLEDAPEGPQEDSGEAEPEGESDS